MLDGQARVVSSCQKMGHRSPDPGAARRFALMAAGCGGSSDTKANEAYANGVCTAIGTWEQQIKTIASELQRRRLAGLPSGEGHAGRGRDQNARGADQGCPTA